MGGVSQYPNPSVPEVGKLPTRDTDNMRENSGDEAQAEELGGKSHLILCYVPLILGLKWSPPHKAALMCVKSQSFSPLPSRNLPQVTSQTHPQSHGVRGWKRDVVKGELLQTHECICLQTTFSVSYSPDLTSAAFGY